MTDNLEARYYVALGAAFVRGRWPELADAGVDDAAVFAAGVECGHKLHKFKRNADLPRVRRVLSMLTGLAPSSLLDIGSGHGAFLWPLLDQFSELDVTANDKRPASTCARAARSYGTPRT